MGFLMSWRDTKRLWLSSASCWRWSQLTKWNLPSCWKGLWLREERVGGLCQRFRFLQRQFQVEELLQHHQLLLKVELNPLAPHEGSYTPFVPPQACSNVVGRFWCYQPSVAPNYRTLLRLLTPTRRYRIERCNLCRWWTGIAILWGVCLPLLIRMSRHELSMLNMFPEDGWN